MKKILFLILILFISILSIQANSGSITIKRYNENYNKISSDLLVDTKVKLFKTNRLIMTLNFDENGEIFVDNLEYGEYKVEEEIAPTGYNIDDNEYVIYLDERKNYIVNIKSKKIEGNLVINKYYGDSNNYKLDGNAVFEIYNNDILIKTLTTNNGVIKERLEYGTYLIKQIDGQKYYDLAHEFTVSINKEQDYKYDLYTDMELELKQFINKKQEELNDKEQQLTNLENNLEKEKNNLINLKNKLIQKEIELNNEKEELRLKKEEVEKLNEEVTYKYNKLDEKNEEITKQGNELKKLKDGLNVKQEKLFELELTINKKEQSVNDLKVRLDLLSSELLKKEKNLLELENFINNKEIDLSRREQEIIKLENKIEEKEVLVVEVPNTYKRNYNKLISIILTIIGIILIVYSKRKATNH